MARNQIDPALIRWIELKPGPFAARTQDACYQLAFDNFEACGDTGSLHNPMAFIIALGAVGCGAMETPFGGFVLGDRNGE